MKQKWDEVKARILSAIDFRKYFAERVEGLTSAGPSQMLGVCPFHGDKKNSFSVNVERGLWNCKGCGEKGDLFTFHAQFHKLGGFNPDRALRR